MFKIGDEVVLKEEIFGLRRPEILPVTGVVYTIRNFFEAEGKVGLRLNEIINEPQQYLDGFHEAAFSIVYFAPVRKTSIDVFTAMLNPVKEIV
jgi:hypothetical protein